MDNIERNIAQELLISSNTYPVVTLLGPRQSGKTTLVKMTFPNKAYITLEDPDIRHFALEDPRHFLEKYPDGAIIDEVQRVPTLLSYIQGIVDTQEKLGLFILTGSHQLLLQQEISQSLAGRTAVLHLMPLTLDELKQVSITHSIDEQLLHGFYPRIYKHNIEPQRFYRDYMQTYIERDVRMITAVKNLDQFQRFLSLCATRVGQLIDYTQLANDLGVSRNTITEWLSIVKASFIITTLPPYFENLGKRIIKSSKLYFTDVGLACYLLGIRTVDQIATHPLRGSLFENLVVNEFTKNNLNRGEEARCYFYRDSNQVEVDLIFQKGLELLAIEIKSSKTFNTDFLKGLKKFKNRAKQYKVTGYVIYAGKHEQQVHDYQVLNYNSTSQIMSQ